MKPDLGAGWSHLDDDGLLAQCTVETFRAGGPGGQHQNVTESAVRLRHRPTGLVVTCRSQRSQHLNRQEALRRLRHKLRAFETRPAPRVPTRPSAAAIERRVAAKRRRATIKRTRQHPRDDD